MSSPVTDDPSQPALSFAFRVYKTLLSPVLHVVSPSRCVYLPTCSEYGYTAMARFGMLRGSWMTLRRLARCHPWAKGGFDPVPSRTGAAADQNAADHLP
jgi:uncharacterized protein